MTRIALTRMQFFLALLASGMGLHGQQPTAAGEPMVIPIRNGDQNGKLMIKDNEVAFESLSDGKRSRTWPYADIRELSKRGRREMRIRPFRGDRYDFQFPDRGQRDKIYDLLAQRVVVARQNRK